MRRALWIAYLIGWLMFVGVVAYGVATDPAVLPSHAEIAADVGDAYDESLGVSNATAVEIGATIVIGLIVITFVFVPLYQIKSVAREVRRR